MLKANPPKTSDKLDKLSPRKRKYVEARASGKSKLDAALEAGYSDSVARKAKAMIETEDVQEAFAALIRENIPAERIAERLSEGLDAMETKFFQKDGEVVESRDVIAWGERRAYLELAASMGAYHIPRKAVPLELTGKDGGPIIFSLRRVGASKSA